MQWAPKKIRLFPLLILCAVLVLGGCEGSEPRNQVDDTVKELSGQRQVEQMDKMKKNLDAINQKHADQLKQVDE